MAIAYNRGCPKERTAHMCTLREGSNYSTTPWFFQKLCCTFSVLVSHIWGIKMKILQKLFQGKCIPVSEHGWNSSCEYEVAVEKLCKTVENLRQYGVPEDLISALDKAENEILALEEELMFRFAIRYGAELLARAYVKGTGHCGLPLSLLCGFLLPFLLPFNLFIGADVPKSVFQKKRVVDHTRALKPSDCVNNPQSRTTATIESVAGKEVNALAQSAFQRDNMFLVFIHQLLAQLLP